MKTKFITFISLGICAAAILTSCTNNTPEINNHGETVSSESNITVEPNKAHFIIKDKPAKNAVKTTYSKEGETLNSLEIEELSITPHERADKDAAYNMKEIINVQGEKRLYSIYDSNNEVLLAEMTNENFDASSLPRKIAVDYTCVRNDGKAISVLETINSYAADQLQTTVTTAYNFVPLTGERIMQVFYTPGNKEEYDAADNTMYEKLVSKYGAELISYNSVSSSFVDVAAECWFFAEDGEGISVIFPAGRITPVEAGALELEYSKEELPEAAQKYFN